jgi:hypothetical protein
MGEECRRDAKKEIKKKKEKTNWTTRIEPIHSWEGMKT